MREFKISKFYWDDAQIYKKSEMVFEPGLTVLVGCNGSGKSTLLSFIKDELKDKDIPVFSYNNYRQGGHRAMQSALFHNKMNKCVMIALCLIVLCLIALLCRGYIICFVLFYFL